MAELISIENLHKSYGANEVLRGISMTVRKGEITAIIGSSGTGKSTLVRCMAGLEKKQQGEIRIEGKRIEDYSTVNGLIGMVFQSFNLFPHYSVIENITKPLMTVLKMKDTEAAQKAEELLAKVKLLPYRDQYPSTLSGGQKQRLAIARALAMDPKIMIFDEPTSSLDPELAHEVFHTISELAREGQTMLIVTHQIHAIRHFATRVVFLQDGRIGADGTCEEIFDHPENPALEKFLSMVEFDEI